MQRRLKERHLHLLRKVMESLDALGIPTEWQTHFQPVNKLISDVEGGFSNNSQRLSIAKETDPREILTPTPTQRRWLSSCLETHGTANNGEHPGSSQVALCVLKQRHRLTPGRCTHFPSQAQSDSVPGATETVWFPTL